MRVHRLLIALASLAPALSAQASSNSPPERTGFYGMLGAGYGALSYQTSNMGNNAGGAGMYTVTLGYMLNPSWRLGAEVDYVLNPGGTSYTQPCCGSSAVFYSASIAYYTGARSDFWLKGNLGYSTYSATYFSGNNPGGGNGMYMPYSDGGIAAGLGIGYDVRLGKSGVIAAPFLSYERQLSASEIPGVPGGFGQHAFLFAGLGVGYNR